MPLLANRREIACKGPRNTRNMGSVEVAVYREADADARCVRTSDETRQRLFVDVRCWGPLLRRPPRTRFFAGHAEHGFRAALHEEMLVMSAQTSAIVDKDTPSMLPEAAQMDHAGGASYKGMAMSLGYTVDGQISNGAEQPEFESAE